MTMTSPQTDVSPQTQESALTEQAVFGVVRTYFPHLAQTQLLDDAAVVSATHQQVVSTDTLVDGRHFDRAYCTAADIAHKSAHVSLSDMAAMGAVPTGLLVSLSLPADVDLAWVDAFYAQLAETLSMAACPLLGGDTVASSVLSITTTALGAVEEGQVPARRFMAKPGDVLALWGDHGLSAVGLAALQHKAPGVERAKQAHLRPTAGLNAAQQLMQSARHTCPDGFALTDTSDGLADGLLNIAEASGVQCVADGAAISVPDDVAQWCSSPEQAWYTVLYGGEDFGLLAALPPSVPLSEGWQPIGTVVAGSGAIVQQPDGTTMVLARDNTYQHFSPPLVAGD